MWVVYVNIGSYVLFYKIIYWQNILLYIILYKHLSQYFIFLYDPIIKFIAFRVKNPKNL